MRPTLFSSLTLAAAAIGSLHTAAPDHWVPFAALARARRWSGRRTAGVTLLCGFGHVTVSAAFGLLGLLFGVRVLHSVGERMGWIAPLLLIGFGVVYALWGLRRAIAPRIHGHRHAHYDHLHDPSRASAWSLFLLFSADPCVAVIPLMFAAAPGGVPRTVAIVLIYEAATLLTMLGFVLPARAGVRMVRAGWLDRWGDAVAGAVIAVVGVAVFGLGW